MSHSHNNIPLVRFSHGVGLDIPSYATVGSAGLDLLAAISDSFLLKAGEKYLIPTGFGLEIPPGIEGQIRTRSGLALRFGLVVLNSPGTIDPDYRGEVKVIVWNTSKANFEITRGMRIAQLVFSPYVRVSFSETKTFDSDTQRGSGGFGSTGV